MKAGRSGLPVGTRVRLRNIADEYDADLNGREGSLAKPMPGHPIRDVGVILDSLPSENRPLGLPVTVHLNEFEVIEQ